MIQAGSLNRRVTLFAPIVQRSASGTETRSWGTLGSVWAAQEALTLREVERMAGLASAAEAKFIIRYRQGITQETELQCEGRRYEVVSVEEIGFREGLRLMVKAR